MQINTNPKRERGVSPRPTRYTAEFVRHLAKDAAKKRNTKTRFLRPVQDRVSQRVVQCAGLRMFFLVPAAESQLPRARQVFPAAEGRACGGPVDVHQFSKEDGR